MTSSTPWLYVLFCLIVRVSTLWVRKFGRGLITSIPGEGETEACIFPKHSVTAVVILDSRLRTDNGGMHRWDGRTHVPPTWLPFASGRRNGPRPARERPNIGGKHGLELEGSFRAPQEALSLASKVMKQACRSTILCHRGGILWWETIDSMKVQ